MSVSDNHEQPTNQVVIQLVVHKPVSDLPLLLNYLNEKCDRFLGRQHDPDEGCNRTHCHFSLINYKHTKQALAKFLNSISIKGSDNFGILTVTEKDKKPYDEHLLNQYIVKGIIDDTIRSKGYTENAIRDYATNYDTYQRDIQAQSANKVVTKVQYKLKVENPKEAKLRKNDFLKMLRQRLTEKYEEEYKRQNSENIIEEIRLLLNEYNEVIGMYKVLDLYDTYQMRHCPGQWSTGILGLLEKRKCRQ